MIATLAGRGKCQPNANRRKLFVWKQSLDDLGLSFVCVCVCEDVTLYTAKLMVCVLKKNTAGSCLADFLVECVCVSVCVRE